MGVRLEISLEEIAKQLNEKDSKYTTLQEVLDELYGIGLTGANIALLIHGAVPVADLFKNFKPSKFLSNFMPNKYINVTKEENAINRYEKLSISNLSIILVSFNQAVYDHKNELDKYTKLIIDKHKTNASEYNIDDLEEQLLDNDNKLLKAQCLIPELETTGTTGNTLTYINILMQNLKIFFHATIQNEDDIEKLIEIIKETSMKYYYINLLEISSEFPEIKLWIDLEYQKEMIKNNTNISKVLSDISDYQKNNFCMQFGLSEIENLLKENSNSKLKELKDMLNEDLYKDVQMHHNYIKHIINEPLLDEKDIDELVLPTRNSIYIPQSYKYFFYHKNIHKKKYLDNSYWDKLQHDDKEDIGKKLFQALRDPYSINQPIIILGHPGAGKSMLSSQFAYKLIDNKEFIPFYIKLRHVDSSNTNINQHINEGISQTIFNKAVDWTLIASKISDRIPVIILDGFDELLRATQTELSNYILNIQELQKHAKSNNLNIRVIITSRLTVMQDVLIPENSLVIKLNSFDEKRKKLWVQMWNKEQTTKKFILPKHKDIDVLSQEPLLLFLLALYDFEDNALSKLVGEDISKSSLYDKLFEGFTRRQLKKDPKYNIESAAVQIEIEELFRLRIGFFASMLFLHDEVHHFEKDFNSELEIFELCDENIKAKNILDGFFFIHKDKSTDGHQNENLSFEFLHRTFGEFLTADFMLRMAKFRTYKNDNVTHLYNKVHFRQIFAFQWIYKQPKTLDFLFEHSKSIINDNEKEILIDFIKEELKNIADEEALNIIPTALDKIRVFEKLKHFAIYSQNLLLLWISLENDSFEFKLSKKINNIQSWKVFVDLWKNYGGYEYVSYLRKYININIIDKMVIICKISDYNKNFTEFSEYTHIANNNYETILSYYDEINITLDDILKLNNHKDKYLPSSIANLIIYKIEHLFLTNYDYFNEDTFYLLWKNSFFLNKIKLSDFYLEKNINYNKLDVARYLYSSIRKNNPVSIGKYIDREIPSREDLSPNEMVNGLIHFIKIESGINPARDMLMDLFKNLNSELNYKSISIYNRLKLIELSLNIDGGSKYDKMLIKSLFKESDINLSINDRLMLLELSLKVEYNNKDVENTIINLIENENTSLSIDNKLKLIEFSLKIDFNKEYIQQMIKDLFRITRSERIASTDERIRLIELSLEINYDKEYTYNIMNSLFNKSHHSIRRLSMADKLRLIELSLEIDYNNEHIQDMIKYLFKERRRLSIPDKLKLIELSSIIGHNEEHIQDMIKHLFKETRRLSITDKLRLIKLSSIIGHNEEYIQDIIKGIPEYIIHKQGLEESVNLTV